MTITVAICPVFNGQQFFDNDGFPLSGGQLWQYVAGSNSTQQVTYTDNTVLVENANPIVLDSSGRLPTEIYLINGEAYNLVLTQSDGTTVLTYVDNVVGVQPSNTASTEIIPVWTPYLGAVTYVGPTQFLVSGDMLTTFTVGNRVQMYNGSAFQYGTISAVAFSTPNTQVTVATDDLLPISLTLQSVNTSILVANGITVDAGAVAYNPATVYSTAGTVGIALNEAAGYIQGLNTQLVNTYAVIFASGSGAYTASAWSSLSTISQAQVFTIQFGGASVSGVQPTLNINSIGAIPILQYTSSGSTVNAIITAGLVSQVAYNGTAFILLNPITSPAASSGSYSPGIQTFTSNGTFTVPAGVTSLKVTTVAGGGGGGSGHAADALHGTPAYPGGNGGNGGVAIAVITPVVAAATYTVSVGAGGVAGTAGVDVGNGVGAGGTGGSTSFNSAVSSSGGGGGLTGTLGNNGANGAGGTLTTGQYSAGSGTYGTSAGLQGAGGTGGVYIYQITAGTAGMCIVEW